MNALDLFVVLYLLELSHMISPFGAEQLRGKYFFVSNEADGYFVNFPPPGIGFESLLKGIFRNRGLETRELSICAKS